MALSALLAVTVFAVQEEGAANIVQSRAQKPCAASRILCKLSANLQVAAGVVTFTPGLIGKTPGKNGRVIPASIGITFVTQSTCVSQSHGLFVSSTFFCQPKAGLGPMSQSQAVHTHAHCSLLKKPGLWCRPCKCRQRCVLHKCPGSDSEARRWKGRAGASTLLCPGSTAQQLLTHMHTVPEA